jgi:hypothetical protein
MQTNSYPPPVRLSQAFESECSSGGGGGSNITRRSFLKRTGGATVATLVAWNMATRNAEAVLIEDSESIPEYRMWVTDCQPKATQAPLAPEGLFDSKEVTWLGRGYQFDEGGKTYGMMLETRIAWGTDPTGSFCQLWHLLKVDIEVEVFVRLYKYELGNQQDLIPVFLSDDDDNWGGERTATVYCDRWSGSLVSTPPSFWMRSRTFDLGGVNHCLRSELTTEVTGSGTNLLAVEFYPQATLYRSASPNEHLLAAPELLDEQTCFAAEWQSFRIV